MLNGDGLRVVLWVAGCTHGCRGCQNPVTWDIHGGIEFDDSAREEIFAEMEKNYISGLTFSGGDPLHPENRKEIFSRVVKNSTSVSIRLLVISCATSAQAPKPRRAMKMPTKAEITVPMMVEKKNFRNCRWLEV